MYIKLKHNGKLLSQKYFLINLYIYIDICGRIECPAYTSSLGDRGFEL